MAKGFKNGFIMDASEWLMVESLVRNKKLTDRLNSFNLQFCFEFLIKHMSLHLNEKECQTIIW